MQDRAVRGLRAYIVEGATSGDRFEFLEELVVVA
jgi:hypothetical protein